MLLRKINFGKIEYEGIKECNTEVEISLVSDKKNNIEIFVCSAHLWESNNNRTVLKGQCLDDLLPYFKNNELFVSIHYMWKKYHLNNMRPGTKEQMKEVENLKNEYGYLDYDDIVRLLKERNMYEVKYKGKPYRYGQAWLYDTIPEDDLNIIRGFFSA